MAVPYLKVTYSGTLSSGLDIWSTGFSAIALINPTQTQMNEAAEAAELAFDTEYWTPSVTGIPASCAWTKTRVAQIGADGLQQASAERFFSTPEAGTAGGAAMPPECSVVASLRSLTPGARGRGRMYLPPVAATNLTTDGQILTGLAVAIAGRIAGVLGAFRDDVAGTTPVIHSTTADANYVVTSVQCGTVVDAQRRRRNKIPENYSTAAV